MGTNPIQTSDLVIEILGYSVIARLHFRLRLGLASIELSNQRTG